MTGKRMDWLKIYTQFPPMRKFFLFTVYTLSCLLPLSRVEGIGLIWILDNCFFGCLLHPRQVNSHFGLCVVQRQPEMYSPLLTKGHIFDPVCFCYSVLGPHAFWGLIFTVFTVNNNCVWATVVSGAVSVSICCCD